VLDDREKSLSRILKDSNSRPSDEDDLSLRAYRVFNNPRVLTETASRKPSPTDALSTPEKETLQNENGWNVFFLNLS
jgi:hypothetical protein